MLTPTFGTDFSWFCVECGVDCRDDDRVIELARTAGDEVERLCGDCAKLGEGA